MTDFASLIAARAGPLVLPGAHDALSARMIADAGFSAYGIGGSGIAAAQLGLPDVGLHSFGEYRDAIRRITEATPLPVMIDGENGFGDAKAVTRTVRTFEAMGVIGLALEDLVFPPRLGRPPAVIPVDEMLAKLDAALSARRDDRLFVIARTDAAYAVSPDEAIARAARYAEAGASAVLATGLPDADAYRRLRAAVTVPIIAAIVPGTPWYAPGRDELAEIGIEVALYPATVLLHMAAGVKAGIAAVQAGPAQPPAGFGFPDMGQALRTGEWAAIDAR